MNWALYILLATDQSTPVAVVNVLLKERNTNGDTLGSAANADVVRTVARSVKAITKDFMMVIFFGFGNLFSFVCKLDDTKLFYVTPHVK